MANVSTHAHWVTTSPGPTINVLNVQITANLVGDKVATYVLKVTVSIMDNANKIVLLLLMCWTITMEVNAEHVPFNVPLVHHIITVSLAIQVTLLMLTINVLNSVLLPTISKQVLTNVLSVWITVYCA